MPLKPTIEATTLELKPNECGGCIGRYVGLR